MGSRRGGSSTSTGAGAPTERQSTGIRVELDSPERRRGLHRSCQRRGPYLGDCRARTPSGATGLLRHFRDERRVSLPLDGDAAQDPSLLYLVFETGGHAYAFETLEEAGVSLEALDLNEGHYVGAFSDQGEVITMSPGDLWITFTSSGTFDKTALQTLIRGNRTFSELADDPHRFALAIWRSS